MARRLRCALLVWSLWLSAATGFGQIEPYPENPFYWQYRGRPLLLFGGSDQDNIFQWAGEGSRLVEHLDLLQRCGGNYIRCTMSSRSYTPEGHRWDLLPYPFAKVGRRYDLSKWNDVYWAKLRIFLAETKKREIVVQLEIWDRWNEAGDSRKPGNGWYHSPWNPNNNINYDWADSPLLKQGKTPFYNPFHLAAVTKDPVLLPYQQRFVRKILDTVIDGGFDHVLFQVDNESGIGDESLEPDPYWARFIRSYVRSRRPDLVAYVCTSRRFHPPAPRVVRRFQDWNNPEVRVPIMNSAFNYCDISQNNGNSGQQQYDNALWYRSKVAEHGARPINNVKCYHFNWPTGARFHDRTPATDAEAGAKFWRAVFAGAASIRFHRDTGVGPRHLREGFGLSPQGQMHIRSMRAFVQMADVYRMEPRNDLLSERTEDEAYCLAEVNRCYAVFFTGYGDGSVVLRLPTSTTAFEVRWLNIATARWSRPRSGSGHRCVLAAKTRPHAVALVEVDRR